MGGLGSGKWHRFDTKRRVEDTLILATTAIREGLNLVTNGANGYQGIVSWSVGERVTNRMSFRIVPGLGSPVVRFTYTTTRANSTQSTYEYAVQTTFTLPSFGGRRWWWLCPLSLGGARCGRRVAKLYMPNGAAYFGCRHCYDLTYKSCQECHQSERFWSTFDHRLEQLRLAYR